MGTRSKGTYGDAIRDLRQAGYAAIGVSDIMWGILRAMQSIAISKDYWDTDFHTTDALIYDKKSVIPKKFKLQLNSDFLLNINNETPLINGAIPISIPYEEVQGTEFVRVQVDDLEFALLAEKFKHKKYKIEELYKLNATPIGKDLGIIEVNGKEVDEVSNSDFLRGLCEYDFRKSLSDPANKSIRDFLEGYNSTLLKYIQRHYNRDKGIEIYLDSEEECPTVRPVVICNEHYTSTIRTSNKPTAYTTKIKIVMVGLPDEELQTPHVEEIPIETPPETSPSLVKTYTPQEVEEAKKELEQVKRLLKSKEVKTLDGLLKKL